ncbi:uncharacterized protein LOC62_07G009351 [Vanrija pseudolonga]|uniref:Uncharacterized protein n=1 Tax=Vanrija pseudolonga TaxID=143232 RepID=A0AAF0YFV8_9TREE|nr:hypothetical protein LOC62_07G009351 [Vanrija pseudolonga]
MRNIVQLSRALRLPSSTRALATSATTRGKTYERKYEVDPGWDRKDATASEADVKADNDPALPAKPDAALQAETAWELTRARELQHEKDAIKAHPQTESEADVRADTGAVKGKGKK